MEGKRKWAGVTFLAICLSTVSLAFGWYIATDRSQKPVAQETLTPQTATLIKIFPAGFNIDAQSVERQDGALAYIAKDATGRLIAISEQPGQTTASIQKFLQENIQQPLELTGTRYPSILGQGPRDSVFMSITRGDTWLTLNATYEGAHEDLAFIAKRLQ